MKAYRKVYGCERRSRSESGTEKRTRTWKSFSRQRSRSLGYQDTKDHVINKLSH